MENQEALLEAKNLRISFKTINGTVKAVRGIDFSLYRGRTLGIVGESGSGKSVTSRAILGILAGNRIIEGGQILYDGMDLLSLSEEEYCKLRGRKISMIFQDPMSSLNPIMRVGEQLTETMFLKEKSTIKAAKSQISKIESILNLTLSKEDKKNLKRITEIFASRAYDEVEFDVIHEARKSFAERIDLLLSTTLVNIQSFRLTQLTKQLPEIWFMLNQTLNVLLKEELEKDYPSLFETKQTIISLVKRGAVESQELLDELKANFSKLKELILSLDSSAKIYYRNELNYDDDKFLKSVIAEAVKNEHVRWDEGEKAAIDYFNTFKEKYLSSEESFDASAISKLLKDITKVCNKAVYYLAERKDDIILTFPASLKNLLSDYKLALKKAKQTEKEAIKAEHKSEEALKSLQLKQRAFSSEISYGAQATVVRIVEVVDTLLAHLQAKQAEEFNELEHADSLYTFLFNEYKDTIKHVTKTSAKMRAIGLLREVGIPEPEKRIRQYPFQFSGGMRQRIVIAIALSSSPEILICDEPTTALDVTIQSQILELITKLKKEKNLSIIFITHDLGVIANMADDIAVMYAGKIVEYGTVEDIFYNPKHPYTWALLASMPDLNTKEKLDAIPGTPPNMILPPKGDAFAARNKYALAIDQEQEPPMFKISETHSAKTWLMHPNAPKAVPPAVVIERIQNAYNAMKEAGTLSGPILDNPYIIKDGYGKTSKDVTNTSIDLKKAKGTKKSTTKIVEKEEKPEAKKKTSKSKSKGSDK